MTLRELLEIIWQRRLLVVLTTLAVVAGAGAYLLLVPVTFSSTAVIRYSALATTMFDGGTGYSEVDLDLDEEAVVSNTIIESAAGSLGEDENAVQASISTELVEGRRTNRLQVTAVGHSPEQAQQRANAVATAYVGHLQGQVDQAVERLNEALNQARAERDMASFAVQSNPGDPVAMVDFENAATKVGELTTRLTALTDAGPPATVYRQALPGSDTGAGTPTILAIAIVSGLIVGVGVALLREQFDDRVRSVEEIGESFDNVTLGEVALIKRRRRDDYSLPITSPHVTPFNESIRSLRTSMLVLLPPDNPVTVVTSPESGEGKTFVTANLAVSLAQGGRSVILVDGDLRKPALGRYFGFPDDQAGLSDAILRDLSSQELEGLLMPKVHPSLRILPAGSVRLVSADLLASDTLKSVLDHLKDLADIVLIDAPPALLFVDAGIIGAQAGGVMVMVALRRTGRQELGDLLSILKRSGAPVLGIVANRSSVVMPSSYGRYGADTPAATETDDQGSEAAEPAAQTGADAAAEPTPVPVPTPVVIEEVDDDIYEDDDDTAIRPAIRDDLLMTQVDEASNDDEAPSDGEAAGGVEPVEGAEVAGDVDDDDTAIRPAIRDDLLMTQGGETSDEDEAADGVEPAEGAGDDAATDGAPGAVEPAAEIEVAGDR